MVSSIITVLSKLQRRLLELDKFVGFKFWKILWSWFPSKAEYLFQEGLPAERICVYFPNIDRLNRRDKEFHTFIGTSYLIKINNKAMAEGKLGWVYSNQGLIRHSFPAAQFLSNLWLYPPFILGLPKLIFAPKLHFNKAFCFLWTDWSNYYHFLVEVLPTLLMVSDKLGEEFPVLIPEESFKKPFVREYLKRIESKVKLIPVSSDKVVVLDEVYFGYQSRLDNMVAWRKKLGQISKHEPSQPYNVFLYRRHNSRRSFSNTDEVKLHFENLGFRVVDPERLSVADQIKVFSNAKLIIAPHGAGLANMLHSRLDEVTVVEIFPSEVTRHFHYRHLCIDLNFQYFEYVAGPIDKHWIFEIDIQDLHHFLERNALLNSNEVNDSNKTN